MKLEVNENIVKQYPRAFQGVGTLKGFKCSLVLKEEYQGKINPCRSIPAALKEKVKLELDRMIKRGIATKVDVCEPAEFVSNLVVVKKSNNGVRVCLNPNALNKAIRRGTHPMKKLGEVCSQLAGSKFFSILDTDQGFWQIEMDEKSSKLCPFITPWGRYRFTRTPFGIVNASEIFQAATDKIFADMTGVTVVIDDILI